MVKSGILQGRFLDVYLERGRLMDNKQKGDIYWILAQMSYLIGEIEKITKEIENEQEKRHDNKNGERV